MARIHTMHEVGYSSPARHYSNALVLLSIASLLIACGGGGGAAPAPGGGCTSENTATLVWDAVVDPGLTGYRIYYGTASGIYAQSIDVENVTTGTVAGLCSKTTYYFVVTAFDASSGRESSYSNEVSKAIP